MRRLWPSILSGSTEVRRSLMTVSIGTGLGAGLVLNGQVLRFLSTTGDTGHIILELAGRPARRAASAPKR